MLPLNASHAYLLAAIAEQDPPNGLTARKLVAPKRGSFTFAAVGSNLKHVAEHGPPYASGLHMVAGFCDLT